MAFYIASYAKTLTILVKDVLKNLADITSDSFLTLEMKGYVKCIALWDTIFYVAWSVAYCRIWQMSSEYSVHTENVLILHTIPPACYSKHSQIAPWIALGKKLIFNV